MINISEKIIQIISNEFNVPENKIEMDSTLQSLELDSIDGIELIMAIDDEFDIDIPEEKYEKVKTLKEMINLVKKYLNKTPS